mmetsp:Transcript_8542/g.18620  ORF Transcript_8542/g.18620 Transcript_8542/m.18620 type:complete len:253 (+) Transcript_8542:3-761(+)
MCWFEAVLASLKFRQLPCDTPLRQYIWMQVGLCALSGLKTRASNRDANGLDSPGIYVFVNAAMNIVAVVLGWYWLLTAKTCASTNPKVYVAVKNLLLVQSAGLIILAVTSSSMLIIFLRSQGTVPRWLTAPPPRIRQEGGPLTLTLTFPRVPDGSPELLDLETGRPRECSICMQVDLPRDPSTADVRAEAETEAEEQETEAPVPARDAVVRTACNHYFHEDCLLEWCTRSEACPICRSSLGGAARFRVAGVR